MFVPEEEKRYRKLFGALRSGVLEVRGLHNGYAFRYPNSQSSIMTIAKWITFEQRCCSFFNFELGVEPEKGPVWLRLTGDGGVKEFLQAEMSARHDSVAQRNPR